MSDIPVYKVGQKVRLLIDEGLDTPPQYQGQVCKIVAVLEVDETNWRSYWLETSDEQLVFCEYYHFEATD